MLCHFYGRIGNGHTYEAYLRTVDNNLGPDRLADPKALDPIYCRQPTRLIARPLYGIELCLFGAKAFHPTHTFNVFSYDAVWPNNLAQYLPNIGWMRYLLRGSGEWA